MTDNIPYEAFSDLTQTDWTFFVSGTLLVFLGVFVAGARGSDGPLASQFGLGIWSGRNFSAFLTMAGIGTLGILLSNRLDEGMLTTWLGDGSVDWANTLGLLTGLILGGAVIVGSQIERDSFLPPWVGPAIGLTGFTILFASASTIFVNEVFNPEFTGGDWSEWLPIFPMNLFFASIYATAMTTFAVAAFGGVLRGMGRFVDDVNDAV